MSPADLVADCARCTGLCCVAPAFAASADFAFAKPAGVACRHLGADARCGIHARLLPAGMRGCVAYDCFGAGQRVVALLGPGRSPGVLRAYELVRQLHELLWYADDALSRPAAAPTHPALRTARTRIDHLITTLPDTPPHPDPAVATGAGDAVEAVDPDEWRAAVAPLLRHASRLVRAPVRTAADLARADLVGRDLAGADLRGADLSAAYLIGADLRGADLRCADLLGTDLRGADLSGADLAGALYLTRTQLGGARGSTSTILPDRLPRPAHWPAT